MNEAGKRGIALAILAGGAAAGFAAISVASAKRKTAHLDRKLGPRLAVRRTHPVRKTAVAIGPIGKWYVYLPISVVAAASLLVAGRRRREPMTAGAIAIVTSAAISALAGPVFDRVLPQPPVPPGQPNRKKPVFPSGHTMGPGAVALTAAYIMVRENIAGARLVAPIALAVPLITASGKVMERKHWVSDVAGGYLAGFAIAAIALTGYELLGEAGPSRSLP
jgi:membrane-associated phospholipid phosphatase